jgi:peptidyl-prolyl cis-trans isomerase C
MKSKGTLTLILVALFFAAEFLIGADAPKKPAADAGKGDKAAKPAAAEESKLPMVVATCEGTEITRVELERELSGILAQQGRSASAIPAEQKPRIYRMVLNNLIVDRLINKRCADVKIEDPEIDAVVDRLKKNFPTEQDFKAQLDRTGQTLELLRESIRTNLRQQHWVDEQIKDRADVSDAEAEDYYKKNTERFKTPEAVRASHILFAVPQDAAPEKLKEQEAAAKRIIERAKKGEDFGKLAKEYSEDPTAKQNSGDLDFFSKDQMVPEFSDAAFKMKQDEVSAEPVRTPFGFHIIKMTGHKNAESIDFEKAKPNLMSFLKNEKKQREIEKIVRELRDKAEVKINLPEEAVVPGEPVPAAAPGPEK